MTQLGKTVIAGILGMTLFTGIGYADGDTQINPSEYSVTKAQATEIALQKVPGTVDEVELEKEDGKVVWEVEIIAANKQEHELLIDANSGEIIKQELDDDDHDDDDHDDKD